MTETTILPSEFYLSTNGKMFPTKLNKSDEDLFGEAEFFELKIFPMKKSYILFYESNNRKISISDYLKLENINLR